MVFDEAAVLIAVDAAEPWVVLEELFDALLLLCVLDARPVVVDKGWCPVLRKGEVGWFHYLE